MTHETSNSPAQTQLRIPATYMRGGTSKGVFLRLEDLPDEAQQPGSARDRLLQRILGSPDAYGKQIDGMGGATSSTSKAVILSPSKQPNHDVDYLFGQVAIDSDLVDWSGNCGNLTAAVAAEAVRNGYVEASRVPENGQLTVRIWQQNTGKTIVALVPIQNGQAQELGDFYLDGVAFPAAPIELSFVDPVSGDQLLPSGNAVDKLALPEEIFPDGDVEVSLINAGIGCIFVAARDLRLKGTELQSEVNSDSKLLQQVETLRAYGALKMGLIGDLQQIKQSQHSPKIVLVAPPQNYLAADGKAVAGSQLDLCVRAFSMGQMHHAVMGTAAVALASAATLPGTLVNKLLDSGNTESCDHISLGHPSGTLKVGAIAKMNRDGHWDIESVSMTRSARVIMEGWVRIPPLTP